MSRFSNTWPGLLLAMLDSTDGRVIPVFRSTFPLLPNVSTNLPVLASIAWRKPSTWTRIRRSERSLLSQVIEAAIGTQATPAAPAAAGGWRKAVDPELLASGGIHGHETSVLG